MGTSEHAQERQERLVEAAMAVLGGVPSGQLNITSLNKALFYLDLYWLLDEGETLTGATYMALAQGPVIAKYDKRLVKALETRGLAKQIAEGMAKPVVALGPMTEFTHLPAAAVRRAQAVGRAIAQQTSTFWSLFSHENPAWRAAYSHGLGSGGPAEKVDLLMALQQLAEVERDPWLDSDGDDCAAAFAEATPAAGEEW